MTENATTEPAAAVVAGTVAVIIPVYNGESFIRRALDSVRRQTYAPAEVFVVDDGSTDNTLEILQQEYADIVTLIQQSRGGPAKARNAAMRVAQSEFLAYLDADDWWEPEKLERQVAMLREHPEAVLNLTSARTVRESDGFVDYEWKKENEDVWPQLQWCNPFIPPACVMVRRTSVLAAGGFDDRFRGNEDWNLWFKLRRMGPFCVCPEPLTDYRMSPGGLSGDGDHMFRDFLPMLDDVLLADRTGLGRAIWRRRIIAFQAFSASMTARAAGDSKTERKYMKVSLLAWPSPFWISRRYKAVAVMMMRWTRLR